MIYLNCDIGEGCANDEEILPFIDYANIACGVHAGNPDLMKKTVEGCIRFQVRVGAHPSFPDRENFGRIEMHLSPNELRDCIQEQIRVMENVCRDCGIKLVHVKPHGALYNMAAKDPATAFVVANAIREFDPSLMLMGLSGSCLITEGKNAGLTTMQEAFADRRYEVDGSLRKRSLPGATIEDVEDMIRQLEMIDKQSCVTTLKGEMVPVVADTICVHGDGPHAVEFSAAIRSYLRAHQSQ